MKAKIIAQGEGWDFWQIGTEVYRANTGAELDIYGNPNGKRWECSLEQWNRFREVFAWAKPYVEEEPYPLKAVRTYAIN